MDERDVLITAGDLGLAGILGLPESSCGLVIFAHGSGSGRLSPRNRLVARILNEAGFATLLCDLLTAAEEAIDARSATLRFDIPLLAARLAIATVWSRNRADVGRLPIGYFGASTGAAAALVAAANCPEAVGAIVSRGGRPDLAGEALGRVRAPTLLIVGSADREVLDLNRHAAHMLAAHNQLVVVPGATHLFEEPGALDQAANHALSWFKRYLAAPQQAPAR